MPIADLCSEPLISLEQNSTLQYAAHLMKQHHVGGLVVLDSQENQKPIGVLTDRDIVLNVVAENKPLTTRVSQVMSPHVVCAQSSQGLLEMIETMEEHGVRRVVVVDQKGRAKALVSIDDLLQILAREMNGLGRLVHRPAEPCRQNLYDPGMRLM